MRHRDLQFQIAQHAEGLRTRHLVDEVRADQQLRLAVGQLADGVGVPYFLEERFRHRNWVIGDGLSVMGNTGTVPMTYHLAPITLT